MKKIIALALCFVMSSFTLAGCSGEREPFKKKNFTPDTQVNGINLDVRDREIEVGSPRTNRCISNIPKTAKSIMRFPFPMEIC